MMPIETELRRIWASYYGVEWRVYLYRQGEDMEWSVRQDDQTPQFIGSATVRPQGVSSEGSAELIDIWITPQYRRQGLGSVLLEDVLSWCREQGHIQIFGSILNESDASYKGLERFYGNAGFEVSFNEERSERLGNMNGRIQKILKVA